ncbi:aspartate-semialdehyde dehydrogenase [Oenococcus oeni]|uniref:aspartate-semialdehyde dehydrogenase n=1 Tax=Oenococcus oeni TaxID=1247 RepID=UPI000277B246|nr:aspartate-semialdehyde dehydrogenase [Oenococcus oeni]EJO00151.1 aspartate semialdehyde dehydrogenase [Oenococcus oeni AWRIB418]KGH59263.1 aspartate-semialdehyde dehydrogenase [Oenococcus oeni IOEB_9805]KGH74921.1 aspartate-semialdehyde dehydrogenase [Oenococcus oeni IOEB_9803]KGH77114.1 aspartate-semialdehyde dehydrogenase [Oenococcus oeni IOEB_8417]KGH89491.1 aspartate-semialdehyde dehydrogenase [Oenococcus oeni S12]
MVKEYNVAILGASGAVGTRMREQLEQSTIPVKSLKLLASNRSAGKKSTFRGKEYTIEETKPESFDGIDLVLSSAGGSVSKRFLPEAVRRGAVAVDNTSYFRMDKNVPLVVPEVNSGVLKNHHGIISNPNCSTIQMVVALKPIFDAFGLKQVIVSTYQAASGAGQSAWNELERESSEYLKDQKMQAKILPVKGAEKHYPLAFNLLPQIDVFEDDAYTHEEWKMIHETKKIFFDDMNSSKIKVTATTVRAPVPVGHGETVYFQVEKANEASAEAIQNAVADGAGLVLQDDPSQQLYPQPINAAGKRETFVGRIRPDLENDGSYWMWVVSDNLLKGAAWNAVQIAEELVKKDLVRVADPEKSYEMFKEN